MRVSWSAGIAAHQQQETTASLSGGSMTNKLKACLLMRSFISPLDKVTNEKVLRSLELGHVNEPRILAALEYTLSEAMHFCGPYHGLSGDQLQAAKISVATKKTFTPGFVLNRRTPFLGTSLDGVVHMTITSGPHKEEFWSIAECKTLTTETSVDNGMQRLMAANSMCATDNVRVFVVEDPSY